MTWRNSPRHTWRWTSWSAWRRTASFAVRLACIPVAVGPTNTVGVSSSGTHARTADPTARPAWRIRSMAPSRSTPGPICMPSARPRRPSPWSACRWSICPAMADPGRCGWPGSVASCQTICTRSGAGTWGASPSNMPSASPRRAWAGRPSARATRPPPTAGPGCWLRSFGSSGWPGRWWPTSACPGNGRCPPRASRRVASSGPSVDFWSRWARQLVRPNLAENPPAAAQVRPVALASASRSSADLQPNAHVAIGLGAVRRARPDVTIGCLISS